MEKQEYSQLELFHKTGDEESQAQRLSGTFLSYIRTYERLVLMLIGIVITGVVCFCIGVEKGKHIALSRINSDMDIAYRSPAAVGVPPRAGAGAVQVPPRAGAGAVQVPPRANTPLSGTAVQVTAPGQAGGQAVRPPVSVPVKVNQPVTVAQTGLPQGRGYTIQIASYAGTMSAQQEVATLKKQGLLPVLRSSGKYTVLCVGNFPDQATAKSLLTQLKRKYRDCYIRRL
jgi:hypothetical protein